MKLHTFIAIEQENSRLDAIVANLDPSCSRSQVACLINAGRICVNQTQKKPGYRVKKGDLITGTTPETETVQKILPQKMDLNICYEDAHILILHKQAGIVVHPSVGNMMDTLVNGLLYYDPDIQHTCDDFLRSGIVHRLDKDTSGLMVVARTRQALMFLQKEFKQRRVEKKYMALVQGHLNVQQGKIDLPIGRHSVKRKIMAVQPESGKKALTLWSVKKQLKTASLVEIALKTGRTHQIRVHFYAMGHPLVGDRIYQHRKNRRKNSAAPRQMLHACFLGFRHPYSGKRVEFQSDLPQDFLSVISKLEPYS